MIYILDFGSQYTKLIARRIREMGVKADILPFNTDCRRLKKAKGIILSGGPSSVYEKNAPLPNKCIYNLNIPVIGLCYGLQAIVHMNGGVVGKGTEREYGPAMFKKEKDPLFYRIPDVSRVWMSHGDRVERLPEGFVPIGSTKSSPYAAIKRGKIYGLQFHPEVSHTEFGQRMLHNFVFRICVAEKDWDVEEQLKEAKRELKRVKTHAILALSGGVDSTVCAVLARKFIPGKFTPYLVDTGLLRKDEAKEVVEYLNTIGVKVNVIDASDEFLRALKGVKDPEKKRKIVGKKFIQVFERETGKADYLIQGTLYPDRIESAQVPGPSQVIKSHHNVGGLPERMNLEVVEPLKELFKDEVRRIARALKIPERIYGRHPFPGPGLSVRIIGEVNRRRLDILREADYIYINMLREVGLYDRIWQAFAVLVPVRTVGVMGDFRTYEYLIALRAVVSEDGMTAEPFEFPDGFLQRVGSEIINRVRGVNRVVYDVSSKPPSTIEWE